LVDTDGASHARGTWALDGDTLSPDHLHRILDHYAQQCCPVLDVFAQSYHWSFMQVACRTGVCHNCETGLISGSVIEYALIWRSARQPSSNPSMNSFPGKPS